LPAHGACACCFEAARRAETREAPLAGGEIGCTSIPDVRQHVAIAAGNAIFAFALPE